MVQRKFHREIYKESKKKKGAKILVKFFFSCFFIFVFSILALFVYYAKELPRPEKFTERQFNESTKIYDKTGEILLYKIYGEEKRTIVPLNEISENLKNAVIAIEDKNFYNHHGIDFKGTMRAISVNLKSKKPSQGGSTITQQLIRSTFLTRTKTIERKIREIILTIEIEKKYSKDQILEWYLNQVPFGSNAYGAEAASQTYFKKPAKDLTIEESAVLAGLIRAPSYLSPYGKNKDELLIRKNHILKKMAERNYISEEQANQAIEKEIIFAPNITEIKAPHFTLYVKKLLEEKYSESFLKEKGLKVYTSLNWNLQKIAEQVIEQGVETNVKYYNAHNAALVAIDPNTGEIMAMKGCKDYFGNVEPEGCIAGKNCLFEPEVNIAIYGIGRQPGSTFKPFAYVTAFSKGYTKNTIVVDRKTNFGKYGTNKNYIPQNYDGLFRGPVTLKTALAQSLNVPAVKVLVNLAGIGDSIKTAQNLGITTLKPPYGASIVLGGWEVRLLEITSAYGVFAADGLKIPPVSILKIEDSKGNIIFENEKTPQRVLGTKETRTLNSILSDNKARSPMFGSNSNLYIRDYQVAGKTGTTEEYKDAWTLGYTPSLVCGVWAGNNNGTVMAKKPAVTIAGHIWKNFMTQTLPLFPKQNFPPINN
ncbi:PBP1A family penicillin-binding protein [Candidatus Parcubacteria bacterium]|nr:PBP1A family penicillin-binding protein [Candidatus Parcubacteria bacterium]